MAQKTDPQDIILVKNIDEGCTDVSNDVVRTSRRFTDEETGQPYNEFVEIPEEWDHKDFFQVKWSSQPHRIESGKTKLMPRYIAEHYAKYLATHMLGKMEKETGRAGLVQSNIERPKMLKRILLEVVSYHLGDSDGDEGKRALAEVEALNPGEKPLDLGVIPPAAVGILKPEPPSLDEIMKTAGETPDEKQPAGLAEQGELAKTTDQTTQPAADANAEEVKTSLYDKSKPLPLKGELIKTAVKLGIDIKGSESSEQLANLIRSF